jgi:hypothetical protein
MLTIAVIAGNRSALHEKNPMHVSARASLSSLAGAAHQADNFTGPLVCRKEENFSDPFHGCLARSVCDGIREHVPEDTAAPRNDARVSIGTAENVDTVGALVMAPAMMSMLCLSSSRRWFMAPSAHSSSKSASFGLDRV